MHGFPVAVLRRSSYCLADPTSGSHRQLRGKGHFWADLSALSWERDGGHLMFSLDSSSRILSDPSASILSQPCGQTKKSGKRKQISFDTKDTYWSRKIYRYKENHWTQTTKNSPSWGCFDPVWREQGHPSHEAEGYSFKVLHPSSIPGSISALYLHNFYGILLAWSAHCEVYFGVISRFYAYGTLAYFARIRNEATRMADQNSYVLKNCGIVPQKAFLHIQISE